MQTEEAMQEQLENYRTCADRDASQEHFDKHVREYLEEKGLAEDGHECNDHHDVRAQLELNTLHRIYEQNSEVTVPTDVTLPASRVEISQEDLQSLHSAGLNPRDLLQFLALLEKLSGPDDGPSPAMMFGGPTSGFGGMQVISAADLFGGPDSDDEGPEEAERSASPKNK